MKVTTVPFGTIAIVLLSMASYAQSSHNENKIHMEATHANKEVVRRLYEQALNKRDMDLLDTLIAASFTSANGAKGFDAFKQPVIPLMKAFPDIQWRINEITGDENTVSVRWTWQGTFTESFQQYTPTHKIVTTEGSAFFAMERGQIINSTTQPDRFGFLQQIGALPTDLQTLQSNVTPLAVNFVDRFTLPVSGRDEFVKQMENNRAFIRTLPGFLKDEAFEQTDGQGNAIIMTVATWKDAKALNEAKELVAAEYKRIGFDPAALYKKLHVTMQRSVFHALTTSDQHK